MEYAALGNRGGSSESTQLGRNTALKVFNDFLDKSGKTYGRDICTVTTLQQFATFLTTYQSTVRPEVISYGTMRQYLSAAKENLSHDFSKEEIWQDHDYYCGTKKSWYKNILFELFKVVSKKCTKDGEKIAEATIPIGRSTVKEIITKSVQRGERTGVEDAYAVNLSRNAVGRGGEAAFATFDTCYWHHEQDCIVMDWGMVKTKKNGV